MRPFLLLTIAATAGLEAQSPIAIGGPATCGGCEIQLTPVLRLDGSRSDYVDEPIALARLNGGRWLMVSMNVPNRILVFDSAGGLERIVGRPGAGPGEYRSIRAIHVLSGDTVEVWDPPNLRRTTLSPEMRVVQTRRAMIPAPWDIEILSADQFLSTQALGTLDAVGLPIHLHDASGEILRSFGSTNPTYRRGSDELLWRNIAPAPEGVWAAHLVRYDLELWSYDGQLIRTIARNVPWFQPHQNAGMDFRNPQNPPNPGLVGLRRDSAGLLWTIIHVADGDWERGVGPVRGIYGRTITGISDFDSYYDTIIEVIDPATEQVLVSARFDEKIEFIGETPYVFSYYEDASGIPFVAVSHVTLASQERR